MSHLREPIYVLDIISGLGYSSIPAFVFLFSLATWFAFRVSLVVANLSRIRLSADVLKMLPLSVRFDVLVFCYVWGAFVLAYFLTPSPFLAAAQTYLWKPIFCVLYSALVLLEVMTFPFMREYGNRFDRVGVEYLKYPAEVFSLLRKHYKAAIVAGTIVVVSAIYLFQWTFDYVAIASLQSAAAQSTFMQLIQLVVVAALVVVGARSSLGHRPANISSAAFSNQHIVNELTLNSTYTLLYDLYRIKHEENPFDIYPGMETDEIFGVVREFSKSDGKRFRASSGTDILNSYPAPPSAHAPYNLVVVIEESLGSDFVGRQGGIGVTPELDRISRDGMFLDQLYATGTRTVRGIEAVISGFPPTPGTSVVKLPRSKNNFWTIGTYLKKHGYSNSFVYGGDANFDEMKAFFLNSGFDEVHDQTSIRGNYRAGSWGYHDGDVFAFAHELMERKAAAGAPFMTVILSTSNHSPFDYPAEEIQLHAGYPKCSHENAIKYADHALGKFYDAARAGSYSQNTVFLFIADHGSRVHGHDLIPVQQFRIPGIIVGPGVPPMEYRTVCSNLDLMPTLLGFMGLKGETPLLGRDLMRLSADDPGRAIMQYGRTYGFRIGDRIAIIRPQSAILDFEFREGKLKPIDADENLNRLALSHALLPWVLYANRLYTAEV